MKYIIYLLLILAACSSSETIQTNPENNSPVQVKIKGDFSPLTKIGENFMARFSPDGNTIIFQSRNRPTHKHAQIYTLNLATHRPHRITYNDGDDFSPVFDPTGKFILYSSTTDEIKEHPEPSPASPEPVMNDPMEIIDSKAGYEEIYESDSDGSHIRRLTNAAGFDGQGNFSPDGHRIVFVSQRGGDFELDLMNTLGHHQFSEMKTNEALARPSFSPDGRKILFETRTEKKQGPVFIKVSDSNGKHIVQLTNQSAINRDPSWFPDGKKIIFSSNREKENIFSLYIMNSDGTCLKRLTPTPEKVHSDGVADIYPTISPDGKHIVFTSNRSGTFQIYIIDFDEPTECLTGKA